MVRKTVRFGPKDNGEKAGLVKGSQNDDFFRIVFKGSADDNRVAVKGGDGADTFKIRFDSPKADGNRVAIRDLDFDEGDRLVFGGPTAKLVEDRRITSTDELKALVASIQADDDDRTDVRVNAKGDLVLLLGGGDDAGASRNKIVLKGLGDILDPPPPDALPTYTLIFRGETDATGEELYGLRPDGTIELINDAFLGPSGGYSGRPIASWNGAHVLSLASTESAINEEPHLLLPDGSVQLLADLSPNFGSGPGSQGGFIEFDDALYFPAFVQGEGTQLFRLTEGGGVELAYDQSLTADFFNIGQYGGFQIFNDALYFTAVDAAHGAELRKYTSDGTVSLVADIFEGPAGSRAGSPDGRFVGETSGFVEFDGALYFSARDGEHGYELRRLSADGDVTLAADIAEGTTSSDPGAFGGLIPFGDALYFSAFDEENGIQLRKLSQDGTVSLAVEDAQGNSASNPGEFGGFYEFNGSLYFVALDGETGSYVLNKLDADGTLSVASIVNLSSEASNFRGESRFVEYDGSLYFTANHSISGYEVRRLDADGTVSSLGFFSGEALVPANPELTVADGRLHFRTPDGDLMIYDGTSLEKAVFAGTASSDAGSLGSFAEFDSAVYFSAIDPQLGSELFKLDADGTVSLVADINPGALPSGPGGIGNLGEVRFVEFNDALYFPATGTRGQELYKLTKDGAVSLVADIFPGSTSSLPRYFQVFEDALYFTARDPDAGFELHKVDADGSVSLVADLGEGLSQSFVGENGYMEFDGALYFDATSSSFDTNLHRLSSDGSISLIEPADGTRLLAPGENGSAILNDTLYFSGLDPSTGVELYALSTDETVSLVADFNEGRSSSNPGLITGFAAFNDELVFAAQTRETGLELHKLSADGQISLVADINDGSGAGFTSNYRTGLVEFDGDLYFGAFDETHGHELRRLSPDGTVSLVSDIAPGAASSFAGRLESLVEFDGSLYFIADGPDAGRALWRLDPETDSVSRVSEVDAVIEGPLVAVDNGLVMRAATIETGSELLFYDGATATLFDINDEPQSLNATNLTPTDIVVLPEFRSEIDQDAPFGNSFATSEDVFVF